MSAMHSGRNPMPECADCAAFNILRANEPARCRACCLAIFLGKQPPVVVPPSAHAPCAEADVDSRQSNGRSPRE
jgi:hypothetical protein